MTVEAAAEALHAEELAQANAKLAALAAAGHDRALARASFAELITGSELNDVDFADFVYALK